MQRLILPQPRPDFQYKAALHFERRNANVTFDNAEPASAQLVDGQRLVLSSRLRGGGPAPEAQPPAPSESHGSTSRDNGADSSPEIINPPSRAPTAPGITFAAAEREAPP